MHPFLPAVIGVILLIFILLFIVWKRARRMKVEIHLSEVEVAPNGIIVDATIQIRNVGRMPAHLSQITLHLIEYNKTRTIEADEVFGRELPCEIGPKETLDLPVEFSPDRPLMTGGETEMWLVCRIGKGDFTSNRLRCQL
jgi:hypothetical protein